MMKKNALWILPLFLITFSCGWTQEPLLLSLKQAENIAVCNNYQINASLHRLEQGYYGYKASRAFFKPQLNFASSIDFAQDEHALDAVVRMTQPLYDKVAYYQLKESHIQWEILKLEVQQKTCEILFEVRNAYYTILLNQAHLAVDQIVLQLWEEEVKRQERLLELGAAIPFELNQTRLQLKSAWSDYYDSQGDIKSSQIKLLTLLGLAPNTSFNLVEKEMPLPAFDWKNCQLEQWKQWALQYRPQLKQEQFLYLLSQNKVSQTKAERQPTVSFYANAGNRYINNGFTGQAYVGTGVNIDWMLYDPSNKPRIRQAEEGCKEAASNYYQVALETDSIIYTLLNELDKTYLAFQNAQEGAALADQGIQMAIRKHQLGMMSSFEYRDAIKNLHEAQQQVNHAKFDLNLAYDRLIQETGLDLKQNEVKK